MTEVEGEIPTQTASIRSDAASIISSRSSSQASRGSGHSKRAKTIKGAPKRNSRSQLSNDDKNTTALTSFPSLSPEPDESTLISSKEPILPVRTASQKLQRRKATLAGLTNTSSLVDQSDALFEDSPRPSLDVAGSLHLTSDDHITRLIARVGAVKLLRQYAQDLAARDAELSNVRIRADLRERELKHMLKEANVPSAEVEKRLLQIHRSASSVVKTAQSIDNGGQDVSIDLSGRLLEALADPQPTSLGDLSKSSSTSGVGLPKTTASNGGLSRMVKSQPSISQLQDEHVLSCGSSRASSVASEIHDRDSTIRPRQTSTTTSRLAGLQNIFQPPTIPGDNGTGSSNKAIRQVKAADQISVKSNQSTKSTTSWTNIFGRRTQLSRSRASSIEGSNTESASTKAVGTLRNIKNRDAAATQITSSAAERPSAQRNVTASKLTRTISHTRKDSNASSLPPTVELDSMIESSQLPPTMTSHNDEGLLVDRYGFIYDRKRKRQHLQAQSHIKNKSSKSESLKSQNSGHATPKHASAVRPASPGSVEEDAPKKSWQEYLKPTAGVYRRPRELLSHTPSAGAVVTVNTAEAEGTITPPRYRDVSTSITSSRKSSLGDNGDPAALDIDAIDETSDPNDIGASKALLEQLTELHDSLQTERTVRWNEFLRRVRAERATTASERGPTNNTPEADLVNGELIGIASLGRSSKTKAKYVHFKTLVLSGIPVSLRPKVWAECTGATTLRIPGYYEDLVARSADDSFVDKDIVQQIRADVKRTLRDNVFFRNADAPGVQRLEELLRAYSIHNPTIGYCQGMNLIAASLMLICATSEDCFWLLVIIIDHILPSGYFDHDLLIARADQVVLRGYVTEVLPRLDAKLQELNVELEACTFHWFLSLYTGVLTGGEALYRAWDVVLCLNSSDSAPLALQNKPTSATLGVDGYLSSSQPATPVTPVIPAGTTTHGSGRSTDTHDGTSSPFLFQLSLALLKLNEDAILALETAAQVYTYLNHNMTAHNITIDALINASELLRSRIKRSDVLERRKKAVRTLK